MKLYAALAAAWLVIFRGRDPWNRHRLPAVVSASRVVLERPGGILLDMGRSAIGGRAMTLFLACTGAISAACLAAAWYAYKGPVA